MKFVVQKQKEVETVVVEKPKIKFAAIGGSWVF